MLFLIQVAVGAVYLFTAPLMVVVVILASSLIAGVVFLISGTIGTAYEEGSWKAVPLFVAVLGAAELTVFLYVQFGFSFGG